MNERDCIILRDYPENPCELNELCLLACVIDFYGARNEEFKKFPMRIDLLKMVLDKLKEKGVANVKDTLLYLHRTGNNWNDYEIKGNKSREVYNIFNGDMIKFFHDFTIPTRYYVIEEE